MQEQLWTADDVAEYLGMTTGWVYREVREGRLPHIKLGPRRVRFRRETVKTWVASREAESRSARGARR